MIDQASAILSRGGGKSFSVRSDYMENLSVRTPMTRLSSVNTASVNSARNKDRSKVVPNHKQNVSWN